MLRRAALLLAIPLAIPAFGAIAVAEESPAPTPIARNQMRDLSADEVDRYIAALEALTQLGLDAPAQLEGDPSALQQREAAVAYGAKMQKVLAQHDFDTNSFTDVHWNVLMAYLAGEMEQPSSEMQEAQAQQQQMLAEMKKQLPPDQYEQAAEAMAQLMPTLSSATNAPEGNRKLVDARRDRLDAIFESAKKPPPNE
jgi:hypothetical protein